MTSGMPIAELFATLGLDATFFNEQLNAAKAEMGAVATQMSGYVDDIALLLSQLATTSTTSLSTVVGMAQKLQAQGLEMGAAYAASIENMNRLHVESEAEAARIASEHQTQIKAEEASDKEYAALKTQLTRESAAAQKQADADWMAQQRVLDAESKAAVAEQAAAQKASLAAEAASQKEYSLLVKQLRAEETAAERVAAEERVAANRAANLAQMAMFQEQMDAEMADDFARVAAYTAAEEAETAAATTGTGIRMRMYAGAGGIRPVVTGSGMGATEMIAGAAAAAISYESIKMAVEFDDALNKSLATMQNVSAEMQGEMRQSAFDLSAQYGISATQIVASFESMQKAGLTAEESLKSLPTVVKYAFATGADDPEKVATAAKNLTTIFNAYKGGGETIEHISELLVQADRMAQGTGEEFATSLQGRAVSAVKSLGLSLEDTLALQMTFARLGIEGTAAQGAAAQSLAILTSQADKHKDVMITVNGEQKKFSDYIYDSSGHIKSFGDLLTELHLILDGNTSKTNEANQAALGLGGRFTQNLKAILDDAAAFNEYRDSLDHAKEASDRLVAIRLDSPKTVWSQFWQEIKNDSTQFGEALDNVIMKAVQLHRLIAIPQTGLDINYGAAPIGASSGTGEWISSMGSPTPPWYGPPTPTGGGSVDDPAKDAKLQSQITRRIEADNRVVQDHVGNNLKSIKADEEKVAKEDALYQREETQALAASDHINAFMEEARNKNQVRDQQQAIWQEEQDTKAANEHMRALEIEAKADYEHRVAAAQLDEELANKQFHSLGPNQITQPQFQSRISIDSQSMKDAIASYQQEAQAILDANKENNANYEEDTARLTAEVGKDYDDLNKKIQTESTETNTVQSREVRQWASQAESAFRSVGSAIATLTVDGGKWGKEFEQVGKNIVKILVEDIARYAFGEVLMAVAKANSSLWNLGASLASIFGSVAKIAAEIATPASAAVGGAADAAGGAGSVIDSTGSLALSRPTLGSSRLPIPPIGASSGTYFDFRGASLSGVTSDLVGDVFTQGVKGVRRATASKI